MPHHPPETRVQIYSGLLVMCRAMQSSRANTSEEPRASFQYAYEQVLRPHLGFAARIVVNVIIFALFVRSFTTEPAPQQIALTTAPNRTDFYTRLAQGGSPEKLNEKLGDWINGLDSNMQYVCKLYEDRGTRENMSFQCWLGACIAAFFVEVCVSFRFLKFCVRTVLGSTKIREKYECRIMYYTEGLFPARAFRLLIAGARTLPPTTTIAPYSPDGCLIATTPDICRPICSPTSGIRHELRYSISSENLKLTLYMGRKTN